MRLLVGAIDEATSGRLKSVLVEGEAGIGKSRLLSEALHLAGDRGYQVASGRAGELEQTRPFGVLVDAFECSVSSPDPRRAAVAALLTGQVGGAGTMTVTSDPGLQFQAVDRFVDLIEAEALDRPLVIGVDDLQWADPSSLLTLAVLCRRLPYVPVALIGCTRPTPQTAELGRLTDALTAAGARRLVLERLGEQDVTGLVGEITGATPDAGLLAEVSAAGGNPLFVTELVRALVQEGAIKVVDGQAQAAEMSLPPTLRLTILRRLSFLSDEALGLLRSASVLGSSFALAELSTVIGRPAFTVSSMLQEAFDGGVLTDDGDRVRFRHDLIRDAIYEDLPQSMRVGLHREAVNRLVQSGAPAQRVAEHLMRSAERGDTDAVEWLTKAARESAASSPGIAVDLLHRAIELTEPTDDARDALQVELGGTLMWAGRLADAEAVSRSLLDGPHAPSVDAAARICLGRCLLTQGRIREALGELELVHQSATVSAEQESASWAWSSTAHVSLTHLDAAVTDAEQARSVAARAGDDTSLSLALSALALVAVSRAQLSEALELSNEAVRCADDSPQRRAHSYPHHITRGHVLLELDQFAEARATLETGMRISEELGVRWPLGSYQTVVAVERFAAGEWDDAISSFEAGLELMETTGERYNLVAGYSSMSLIALHRNDLERAALAASAAGRELTGSGWRYRGHWARWVQALLAEARGDIRSAFVTLAECWDRCAGSGLTIEYPLLGPDLVRLAVATGDHARADQVTSAVAGVAADNGVASFTGSALRCQGMRDGDPDALRSAVDAYAQSPRPLELALACEETGVALAKVGNARSAVEYLDRALVSYDRLEAARDAARTQSRLRRLGVRRGRRGARQRPQSGWGSLTTTERAVTDLVAEGLSNPQIGERMFVSRRTVQTHLAHVFQKLQVSSRTELATALTRHREQG